MPAPKLGGGWLELVNVVVGGPAERGPELGDAGGQLGRNEPGQHEQLRPGWARGGFGTSRSP